MEILDEKGVLSMEVLPAGFEETKRSKIQQVLIDGDIEGLLTTLTETTWPPWSLRLPRPPSKESPFQKQWTF